jgi:hypothetical protein
MFPLKNFDDLRLRFDGINFHQEIRFANGYGVSVITFDDLNGARYGDIHRRNGNANYEIMVLKIRGSETEADYSTWITSDVVQHLSSEEVSDIMKAIQELDPRDPGSDWS